MTILLAYVPTQYGEAALDCALREAKTHGDDLSVVNVARGEAPNEPRRLYDEQMRQLEKRLQASGVNYSIHREITTQDPAEQILEIAASGDVAMIVIGLRRRSRTGKLLFGSTAQSILLEAECPVLAAKD